MCSRCKLKALVATVAIGNLAAAFVNPAVTPTTYLPARRGRIVTRYVGESNWTEFHPRIENALADPRSLSPRGDAIRGNRASRAPQAVDLPAGGNLARALRSIHSEPGWARFV
jgi:hypothetical protein